MIVDNVNASINEDGNMVEHLADHCVWEARTRGITKEDLIEALSAYMLLNRAVQCEGSWSTTLVLPVKKKELAEAEAMRRYIDYKARRIGRGAVDQPSRSRSFLLYFRYARLNNCAYILIFVSMRALAISVSNPDGLLPYQRRGGRDTDVFHRKSTSQ